MVRPVQGVEEKYNMASRGDSDRYEFGDSASVHGVLAPWSEDQTTTTYSAEHMHSLRQHVRSTSPMLQAGAPSFRESSWDDSPEIIEIREAAVQQSRQTSQSWEEDLAEYPQDTGAAIAAAWSEAERELQARKEQQQLTAAKTPKQSGAYAKQTLAQQSGQFAAARPHAAQPARRQSVAFPAPQPTAAQTQPARPMRAARTLPQPAAVARAPRTLPGPASVRPSLPPPMLLPAELDDAPRKRESIWVGPAGYAVAGALGLLAAVFFGQALFDPGANAPVPTSASSTPAPAPVAPPARVETDPVAAAAASSLPSQPSAASAHASSKSHPAASTSTSSTSSDGSVHMTWRERRAARLAAEAEARAERQNTAAAPASEPSAPTRESRDSPTTPETSHSAATRDVLAEDDKADDLLAPSAPAPAKAATSDDSSANDSAAHGTLRINSRPWSQVYVDGKLIGNTPQMSIDVKSGAHSVRLVNSEFSMSKVIELNVAPGEVVSRVEMLDE